MSSATVLDGLKKAKTVKYGRLTIKMPEDFKAKIEYIIENNDINTSDYIVALLEKSEINKVYVATKKAVEAKSKKGEQRTSDIDDTSNSCTNTTRETQSS